MKKILWFTDTISDLNGVAATISEMAHIAVKDKGLDLTIVSTKNDSGPVNELFSTPPKIIYVDSLLKFKLPFYKVLTMTIPSPAAYHKLMQLSPCEIWVSTPGPIGMLGLYVSKQLKVKSIGVYHTDFTAQTKYITQSDFISYIINKFEHWFYSKFNLIYQVSPVYVDKFIKMGYESSKVRVFPKAIDPDVFHFVEGQKEKIRNELNINKNDNLLLYTGRISRDKNLDFIINMCSAINSFHLALVGYGPYFDELKKNNKCNRIHFMGAVKRNELKNWYSAADAFLFPSTTDTFGMVVLEALACGCPAIVSNQGGPQSIVKDGENGLVVEIDLMKWFDAVIKVVLNREKYTKNAVEYINQKYSWKKVFNEIKK